MKMDSNLDEEGIPKEEPKIVTGEGEDDVNME